MRIRWGARKITGIFQFIAVIWHSDDMRATSQTSRMSSKDTEV